MIRLFSNILFQHTCLAVLYGAVFGVVWNMAVTYFWTGSIITNVTFIDIPDITLFSVAIGGIYAGWHIAVGRTRKLLVFGFSLETATMFAVITVNRTLEVAQESGFEKFYIIPAILGVFATLGIVLGYTGFMKIKTHSV